MFTLRHRHVVRSLLASSGFLAAAATAGSAQRIDPDLAEGRRIRIRAEEVGVPWSTTAIVDSLGPDTLWVRQLSDPPRLRAIPRLAVPLRAITRLELEAGSASRWSHARKGALWGLLAWGMVAGAYVAHEHLTCSGPECYGEGYPWIPIIGGFAYTAGAGAVIGASLPVQRWRPVPVR